ncbi:MAG: hypothetical protein FK731_05145 [Asgard group archaeon]|nr:hypothetical protein [Asgard group archaeon]
MDKPLKKSTNPNIIEQKMRELYESDVRIEVICVFRILSKCICLSTNEIVKLALTPEYEDECITCASAESVYRGIRYLQDKGWIVGHIQKGGYVWQLICF